MARQIGKKRVKAVPTPFLIQGGDDQIYGGSGADNLNGDAGADRLYGSAGNDFMRGNDGNDLLYGGDDVDRMFGDAGDDTLRGQDGNDRLYGAIGEDRLFGEAGDDTLRGQTADYDLYGGTGDDTLQGDAGADFLRGDEGSDTLTGGNGADDFVWWANTLDIGVSDDTVTDFSTAEGDQIKLLNVLSGFDPLADLITDFVQITDDGTDSFLAVDVDGGADNFVQIATLLNVTGLTDEQNLADTGVLIVT